MGSVPVAPRCHQTPTLTSRASWKTVENEETTTATITVTRTCTDSCLFLVMPWVVIEPCQVLVSHLENRNKNITLRVRVVLTIKNRVYMWRWLQMQLGSCVAVAGSCNSDSTPSQGNSMYHGCSPKKQKNTSKNKNKIMYIATGKGPGT